MKIPIFAFFFLPGRTWVRVARCHSWGRLCGQIAKVILHRGLFDIVLTNRPRHSVASATWCRTVGQRHFGPRKYKACHSDPKLRIPFGNCWLKPRYFLWSAICMIRFLDHSIRKYKKDKCAKYIQNFAFKWLFDLFYTCFLVFSCRVSII